MLAKNTRTSVAAIAAALITGLLMALSLALVPAPAQAQDGDVLKLLTIKCDHITGDEGGILGDFIDEPYIKVDGIEVWSGRSDPLRMKVGDVRNLSGVSTTLTGQSARVQLWESDPGVFNQPDDGPAEFFAEYTGGDQRTQTLNLNGGTYEITYRVERPTPPVTPPETVIESGPSGPTRDNTPTFTFSGSDDVTPSSSLLYSYKVDEGTWSPFQAATSATTNVLSDGPHTFYVRAKDEAGNVDASPADRNFAVDTVKPSVTSVVPGEKATGVAPGTNVSALFSEDMKSTSINGNTVKLFKAGTTNQIGGAVSYDPLNDKATFNPFSNLQRGTKYKAVVTSGVKDKVGNPLDQNPATFGNQAKSWVFTIRN